ncbi:hypothetical protein M075_0141 [Bacteroides fragilis str. 20793-3]|nr:hypothetical protein M075_0141 [Bacteroides fragilis str. 20793-3]
MNKTRINPKQYLIIINKINMDYLNFKQPILIIIFNQFFDQTQ